MRMLLRITLASLDGSREELVVAGGERADEEDAPGCRPSLALPDRCGASWATWFVLRLSALPFGSLPDSPWAARRGESVERSLFGWGGRREPDAPLEW